MKEQVAGSAGVTGAGIGLTQTPVDWLQVVGILIAGLGLIWNIYAVITRNQHNRYMREKRDKSDGNTPPNFFRHPVLPPPYRRHRVAPYLE
ncbi:hypothetical protein Misp06_03052 [Microbulbifer sp. NBRC 101763]|uniref:hypothetical protein n=1 Tax=Microbulbifer sp. NBRC 101763 TaxID=1113820 RepID=UPI0030A66F86